MIIILAVFGSLLSSTVGSKCQRVVCYYTNWAQYRPKPFKFFPENIDPSLCTHVNYAFAKMEGNKLAPFEWNDETESWAKGMYERCKERIKPGTKLLMSVGGWNMGTEPFTAMVRTATGRQEFATSSASYLRQRGFDGLDLDWEYPASRGSPQIDKHNYVELVKVLNRTYAEEAARTGRPRLLLTAAVSAGKATIDKGYNVPEISKYMDFINIMAYDLHGSWESVTGHNSPLYASPSETGEKEQLNVDWAAKYWVQLGLAKDKLVLGLPTYGRTFQLTHRSNSGLGAPAKGAGPAGRYTREAGFLAYYEVCQMIKAGATPIREPTQKVPYLVTGDQWVGYDDEVSLREKVSYMSTNGYGGVMIWALDLDDFTGSCGKGNYSLLKAIVNECHGLPPSALEQQPIIALPQPQPQPQPAPSRSPISTGPITQVNAYNKPGPSISQIDSRPWQHTPQHAQDVQRFQAPVNQQSQAFPAAPPQVQQMVREAALRNFLTSRQENRSPFFSNQNSRQAGAFRNAIPKASKTPMQSHIQPVALSNSNPFSQSSFSPRQRTSLASIPLVSKQPSMVNAGPRQVAFPKVHGQFPDRQGFVSNSLLNQLARGGSRVNIKKDDSTALFNCLGKLDGLYKSPESCNHYFTCEAQTAIRKACGKGLVFNPQMKYCDWPYNYKCDLNAVTTIQNEPSIFNGQQVLWKSSPNSHVSKTDGQYPIGGVRTSAAANFCKGMPDGRYSHPDCNKFIDCISSITYEMPCASGTAYSRKGKICIMIADVPGCNQ